ncbi:hypothetical protein BJV82DRAFT_630513 [Fennellomyces sp. T-0311]|nr:hypothetical protein BJV82DRAFT_630513 [Fennellomyces sp. T-0311]
MLFLLLSCQRVSLVTSLILFETICSLTTMHGHKRLYGFQVHHQNDYCAACKLDHNVCIIFRLGIQWLFKLLLHVAHNPPQVENARHQKNMPRQNLNELNLAVIQLENVN